MIVGSTAGETSLKVRELEVVVVFLDRAARLADWCAAANETFEYGARNICLIASNSQRFVAVRDFCVAAWFAKSQRVVEHSHLRATGDRTLSSP
jgi:hypothetical protein